MASQTISNGGFIQAGVNLYLPFSLNLISDDVGQTLKIWRGLHRQQDNTERVTPRYKTILFL